MPKEFPIWSFGGFLFVAGVASGDPCHFMSLGAACGDPVFCCSGTASADPCDFISVHRIISLGTAFGDSVFCSVAEHLLSSGTASGDPSTYILHLISSHFSGHRLWRLSFPPLATLLHIAIDFIASFLWAPPVATQFSVLS